MLYVPFTSKKGFNINDTGFGWFYTTSCYAPSLHYRNEANQGMWFIRSHPEYPRQQIITGQYRYMSDLGWFNNLNDFSEEGIAKEIKVKSNR